MNFLDLLIHSYVIPEINYCFICRQLVNLCKYTSFPAPACHSATALSAYASSFTATMNQMAEV